MSSVVLDASAVLAVIFGEAGAERVAEELPGALVLTVNMAEVVSKAGDKQVTHDAIRWMIQGLQVETIPFDDELAYITGSLRESTREFGLSLGDRACLALGLQRNLPVLTADILWASVDVGVQVELVR